MWEKKGAVEAKEGCWRDTSAAEEVVVQVESLLTPGCYISCTRLELLLGAGPNTVNTAQAPPT